LPEGLVPPPLDGWKVELVLRTTFHPTTTPPNGVPMIVIVDYGMGNLRSVQKAVERVGGEAKIVQTPRELAGGQKIIVPGVGAFRDAIERIRAQGLDEPLVKAIRAARPSWASAWAATAVRGVVRRRRDKGLGVFGGQVRRFQFENLPPHSRLPVPHIGWNQLRWDRPARAWPACPATCMRTLCTATTWSRRMGHRVHDNRIRLSVRVLDLEGQRLCLPVPPGKEPGCGAEDPA